MTSGRDQVAQQPPSAGLDLTGFPETELDPAAEHSRAHTRPFDAHYFSCSGEGRFDLTAPSGTCYVAASTPVAVREWLGPARTGRFASVADRDRLEVTVLTGIDGRAANVSAPRAANFGITGELTAMTPYHVPQAWARRLHSEGFDAVQYIPRFTPGEPSALGLFGAAGPGPVAVEVRRIDGKRAFSESGLEALPVPPSSRLRIV